MDNPQNYLLLVIAAYVVALIAAITNIGKQPGTTPQQRRFALFFSGIGLTIVFGIIALVVRWWLSE